MSRLPKRAASVILLPMLAAACAGTPPPPALIADADRQLRVAASHYQDGRLADALQAFRRAERHAERIDDARRITEAQLGQGASALRLERPDLAGEHYTRARAEARRAGLGTLTQAADLGLAETARRTGRLAEAEAGFRAALDDADLAPVMRGQAANGLALTRLARGDAPGAERLLADTRQQLPADADDLLAATLANQARVALVLGRAAAAAPLAWQALDIDRRRLDPPAIAADHALLADIARAQGSTEAALAHARRAMAIRRQLGLADTPAAPN